MRAKKIIMLALVTLLGLTACKSHLLRSTSTPQVSANEYLQMAATSEGSVKQGHLLSAAQRLLQDHQLKESRKALENIDADILTESQQIDFTLLRSEYRIMTHRERSALNMLYAINQKPMSDEQQIFLHKLYARAYLNQGRLLSSMTKRIQLSALLSSDEEKQKNLIAIWQSLQPLNTEQLESLKKETDEPTLQGWIEFALITNNNAFNAPQLIQALKTWQTRYPNHAANGLINEQIAQVHFARNNGAQNVALLLPLNGKLAQEGQAIKNGFFAAYYAYKKQSSQTISNIRVYDTSQKNIRDLYQQALKDGAHFIVGPLTKKNVSMLENHENFDVPVLALNTLEDNNPKTVDNLYQFSLSPVEETSTVARRAWNNNLNKAIVIAPKGDWGESIANALSNEWEQLGGTVLETSTFSQQENFSYNIQKALNVDQSQARAKQLRHTLGKKVRYLPQRRQDVDVIFLAALPKNARQLRPLLQFYFAGNIPVYAPSFIYSGIPNNKKDRDLNGVLFGDMPWVINPQKNLSPMLLSVREQIRSLWVHRFANHPKLYAVGVDAYRLVDQLDKLKALPQLTLMGATGRLSLMPNGHIRRQLIWAQMRYGAPHEL